MISLPAVRLVVREYLTNEGRSPYREWLDDLDTSARARAQARVLRFESGNFGDHKSLAGGVWEARLLFGPGYRIYFGKIGSAVILLLAGGDKKSQRRDIRRAQAFWADFLEATNDDET